ncbi:MAG: hypothetical protein RPU62_00670 [Candidatus Sedimenticola sp. (ex Thyasira tokunagai)]
MNLNFVNKIKPGFLILLFFGGCFANYTNYPNMEELKKYVLEIDDDKYTIFVPGGGVEGGYNTLSLNSRQETDHDIVLLTIGYDHVQSQTHQHNLTHFLFGLTKDGCCDLERASDFERDNGNHAEAREVGGSRTLYVEKVDGVKNLVSIYYLPYNEKYNMFFSLILDNEFSKDEKAMNIRKKMLRNIVRSVKIEKLGI